MSLQVFTWIPEHPNVYRPRRRTKRYRFDGSDAEQRFTLGSRTKRVYRWPFRVAAASGYREAIDAFLEARSMGAESFLVKDLKDFSRTGISVVPATSDGVVTAFSLPTTGQYAGDYPINDAHAMLYRAGVSVAPITVQTDARTLTKAPAPAAAGAMTADYWYYRRVCLAQESEEYEWEEPVYGVFRTVLVFEEVAAQ